ncbi:unnamed protein product [Adineta steineri]|uniref:RING-type domain-containing protein n=1 Tax=Adineta steineri TaxID=433720 RepID=A0A813SZG0_9BILA|nr:unnamed protein product [Adineta steineri]CAF3577704.1 unnamed protein product [Adineta steineri]
MPPLPPPAASMATRKRTRSTNVAENNVDHQQVTAIAAASTASTAMTSSINMSSMPPNTNVVNAPPKRQRNNPPSTGPPPPIAPRTNYLLRNRSLTPDPRHPLTRFPSLNTTATANRQRYNLRQRHAQSQIRLPQVPTPHPTVAPRRIRRPIPPVAQALLSSSSTNIAQPLSLPIVPPTLPPPLPPPPIPILPMNPPSALSTPPVIQPRQYRLVYLSDEDDDPSITAQPTATLVNTTLNLITDDEDDGSLRAQGARRRTSRTTSNTGFNTRSRTAVTIPSSASSSSSSSSTSTINTQEFISGVAHVRLNRAIEIVIDSIQSLEGAVNNFDQLVFGLIYGRLGTRTEFESIEGMIRLSRILNLNVPPSRLTQAEIDELPKIIFVNKTGPTSSIHLVEKCPICLSEFDDQETINKLHCTHLFHLQCISTWLSENDSCPTCRRKVMGN